MIIVRHANGRQEFIGQYSDEASKREMEALYTQLNGNQMAPLEPDNQ